ncbi:PAS domain-containing protein [Rhodovibrio sodomensis]|nr:PAS domain-containing protein [Rhodovibrio sodomensis]
MSLARVQRKLRSPELLDLLDLWSARRGARSMPRTDSMDLSALETHSPRLVIAKVLREPLRFVFTFVGADLEDRLGESLVGRELTDARPVFFKPYAVCVSQVRATREFASFDFGDGEDPGSFERLLLPLSEDDAQVDAVLGGIIYSNVQTSP